jgi:enoyl-CoA hydratase/carnithine racemase
MSERLPLQLLQSQRQGRVLRLTLSRSEQFNALSEELLDELEQALVQAAKDPELRVVVLAAEGKAFCAGHDLKQMMQQPELAYYQRLFAKCSKVMLLLQQMPQIVIARVQGLATAAGCQLVAMCDLAVASSEARFAVSGVNLGLFCATPSVALGRNLSRKEAFEMLVTGGFISAQQALEKGLVNRVVSAQALDEELDRLIVSILDKPAQALAAGKGLFYKQLEMGIEAAYQLAGQTMACNMMEASALEGVQAFIDKRTPDWKL